MFGVWDTGLGQDCLSFPYVPCPHPLRTWAAGATGRHYRWTETNDPDLLSWNLRKTTWGRPWLVWIWRDLGTKETHRKYLFSFPPDKCNECKGVDANYYILLSLQFCFINGSTGSCSAEYCILSRRQPDHKYWRKGNFKVSLMNRCSLRMWTKMDP